MNKALILEDHPAAQMHLHQVLQMAFPGIEITCKDDLTSALGQPGLATFDLALIDLALPDGNGIEFLKAYKVAHEKACAVITTMFADDQHVFPALSAGADGYLLKDQQSHQLVEALQGIAEGRPPLSPAIARRLMGHFRAEPGQQVRLTERETEVLQLIAKGLSVAKVAGLLNITRNTVSGYVKDVYRKLNISSRAEATLEASKLGLVR